MERRKTGRNPSAAQVNRRALLPPLNLFDERCRDGGPPLIKDLGFPGGEEDGLEAFVVEKLHFQMTRRDELCPGILIQLKKEIGPPAAMEFTVIMP